MDKDTWESVKALPPESSPEVSIEVYGEDGNLLEVRQCWRVAVEKREVCQGGTLIQYRTETFKCSDGRTYQQRRSRPIGPC